MVIPIQHLLSATRIVTGGLGDSYGLTGTIDIEEIVMPADWLKGVLLQQ